MPVVLFLFFISLESQGACKPCMPINEYPSVSLSPTVSLQICVSKTSKLDPMYKYPGLRQQTILHEMQCGLWNPMYQYPGLRQQTTLHTVQEETGLHLPPVRQQLLFSKCMKKSLQYLDLAYLDVADQRRVKAKQIEGVLFCAKRSKCQTKFIKKSVEYLDVVEQQGEQRRTKNHEQAKETETTLVSQTEADQLADVEDACDIVLMFEEVAQAAKLGAEDSARESEAYAQYSKRAAEAKKLAALHPRQVWLEIQRSRKQYAQVVEARINQDTKISEMFAKVVAGRTDQETSLAEKLALQDAKEVEIESRETYVNAQNAALKSYADAEQALEKGRLAHQAFTEAQTLAKEAAQQLNDAQQVNDIKQDAEQASEKRKLAYQAFTEAQNLAKGAAEQVKNKKQDVACADEKRKLADDEFQRTQLLLEQANEQVRILKQDAECADQKRKRAYHALQQVQFLLKKTTKKVRLEASAQQYQLALAEFTEAQTLATHTEQEVNNIKQDAACADKKKKLTDYELQHTQFLLEHASELVRIFKQDAERADQKRILAYQELQPMPWLLTKATERLRLEASRRQDEEQRAHQEFIKRHELAIEAAQKLNDIKQDAACADKKKRLAYHEFQHAKCLLEHASELVRIFKQDAERADQKRILADDKFQQTQFLLEKVSAQARLEASEQQYQLAHEKFTQAQALATKAAQNDIKDAAREAQKRILEYNEFQQAKLLLAKATERVRILKQDAAREDQKRILAYHKFQQDKLLLAKATEPLRLEASRRQDDEQRAHQEFMKRNKLAMAATERLYQNNKLTQETLKKLMQDEQLTEKYSKRVAVRDAEAKKVTELDAKQLSELDAIQLAQERHLQKKKLVLQERARDAVRAMQSKKLAEACMKRAVERSYELSSKPDTQRSAKRITEDHKKLEKSAALSAQRSATRIAEDLKKSAQQDVCPHTSAVIPLLQAITGKRKSSASSDSPSHTSPIIVRALSNSIHQQQQFQKAERVRAANMQVTMARSIQLDKERKELQDMQNSNAAIIALHRVTHASRLFAESVEQEAKQSMLAYEKLRRAHQIAEKYKLYSQGYKLCEYFEPEFEYLAQKVEQAHARKEQDQQRAKTSTQQALQDERLAREAITRFEATASARVQNWARAEKSMQANRYKHKKILSEPKNHELSEPKRCDDRSFTPPKRRNDRSCSQPKRRNDRIRSTIRATMC
ncbi:MAG: hypothetical protein OXC30_00505 [Alphaproteobacteria bacterium]|nr:hypothetical protein [Alphaproteobacteria bacterium]